MTESAALTVQPLGRLVSDYPDKFGVPRQPGLVTAARGIVTLYTPFDDPLAFEGLANYSHLWLSFVFDRSPIRWRPRVRPPRLGGNARMGVFATRSPVRPNRLGLSAVRLLEVATTSQSAPPPWVLPGLAADRLSRTHLLIGGHDLVSGTPVVDIKPYVPWVDGIDEARADWAASAPTTHAVHWAPAAERWVMARADGPSLKALIEQVLSQDPRPAYRRRESIDERSYGVALRDVDIKFRVSRCHGAPVMQIVSVTG